MPINEFNGNYTNTFLQDLLNQVNGSQQQGISNGGCCEQPQQQPQQEAKISKDYFNGKTIIDAGNGNDNIRVSNGANGGLNVNVNGQNYSFNAQEAANLVIRGGNGNDNIRVDSNVRQNLTIEGGNGNDNITGGRGNDRIFGGAGNDTINGGRGNDQIWGGRGNDTINGGRGNDFIHGGSGNDTLSGGRGNDTLIGGTGADSLNGGRGNDNLNWGNAGLFDMLNQDRAGDRRGWEVPVGGHTQPPYQHCGNDSTAQTPPWSPFQPGNGGNNFPQLPPNNCWLPPHVNQPQATVTEHPNGKLVLDAGAGDDKINVTRGYKGGINVNVNGENHYFSAADAKRLEIRGGSGNAQITVAANVRQGLTLRGGSGDDTIIGGSGNDRIFGGGGNDVLAGRGGNDYINGGNGNDTILGGRGNDTLVGGNGNDMISGGRGNDAIYGGNGNDTMFGGQGNDYINGGSGRDYANGGQGFNRGTQNENFLFRLMQARLRQ
jgi:Ca2+-binding RTX toxin-like protein